MATETTQQIVREAPEVEAYKLDLLKNARGLAFGVDPNTGQPLPANQTLAGQLPAYQVAGFSPQQQAALNAASQTGIGSFGSYIDSANSALNAGYQTTAEAADVLRGADTRGQFFNAQQNTNAGANALNNMEALAARSSQANLQPATSNINQGIQDLDKAQQLTLQSRQANLNPSNQLLNSAAQQTAASQADYGAAERAINAGVSQGQRGLTSAQTLIGQGVRQGQQGLTSAQGMIGQGLQQGQAGLQAGIGQLSNSAQGYNPQSAQAFMDPYKQQVIDRTMAEMDRQAKISGQSSFANAVRAGATGGSRDAIQRAEMERNLMDQKSNTIASLLSQGYSQSQAQAQQAFEQQQQRGIQAGTGIGSLAAQQGQLGVQAGQTAGALSGQQAQLGVQAGQTTGALAGQQGQLGVQAGQALGGMETQGTQLGLQAAGQTANIGQTMGQQAVQQAQLGQSAASQYGNLGAQQISAGQGLGQLGVQQAQVGQGAASLMGQAAGQYGTLATQQGQLAGQQFAIGQQTAAGLGALGAQAGQLGINQAALGQTAQNMNQSDINFLYNTGQAQQALNQQGLDAQRATQTQQAYLPYQQAGFLSDIYRGAPSTQMSTAVASQPSASPFQQAVGVGLGAVATAAGAKKAGLFGP